MPMSLTAAQPWLTYWYAALRHPLGIWLRTPEPARLSSLLYNARNAAKDPQLSTLTIRTSPLHPGQELWITHSEAASAPAAS